MLKRLQDDLSKATNKNPKIESYAKSAETGDAKAFAAIGWFYKQGKLLPFDIKEALKWYRLASDKGNLNAQLALGWIFFAGEGVNKNLDSAKVWYAKAAAQGNPKAQQMLKNILLERKASAAAKLRYPLSQ